MSCVCAFKNGKGDDGIDANGRDRRLGEPVTGHAILERARMFGIQSADYSSRPALLRLRSFRRFFTIGSLRPRASRFKA
jgi:hypothetical protein